MSKLVHLTFVGTTGRIYHEFCELLEEDDEVCYGDDIPIPFDIHDDAGKRGLVLFQDYEGVFGLEAHRIQKIEIIR